MNKKTYSQILDDVAHDQLPADLDLAPQIMAQIQKGKSVTMKPRMKRFSIVIVTVLVMAVVLVNVPAVAAAIQRWFGYVPGIGLVREGQTPRAGRTGNCDPRRCHNYGKSSAARY